MQLPFPPDEPATSPRWASPEYAEELAGWVSGHLGPATLTQHRIRPWSTVLTADTDGGRFWVKENAPAARFEAGLAALLARLAPDLAVPVTAVEPERGLLLTPDQGEVLGFEHDDVATWERIVAGWARLQRALLPHEDEVRDAGVTAMRVAEVPDVALLRAEQLGALAADDPRHLPAEAVRGVERALPDVRRAAEAVAALGLPLALNHNDLHGSNVFAAGERYFDLGDVLLTDPMAVLLVPVGILHHRAGCALDDPRLWRLAEAWLDVWDDLAPRAELRAALPHALRLAKVPKHEAWLRITPPMTPAERVEWASDTSEYISTLPEPPLLGATA